MRPRNKQQVLSSIDVTIMQRTAIRTSPSSRLLRKARPKLARRYWRGTLWPPSYFAASTGGERLAVVRRYVEQQRASSGRERQGFRRGEFR